MVNNSNTDITHGLCDGFSRKVSWLNILATTLLVSLILTYSRQPGECLLTTILF
jgi:hypothetical protein